MPIRQKNTLGFIDVTKTKVQGLERWLCGLKHFLLLQKTQAYFRIQGY